MSCRTSVRSLVLFLNLLLIVPAYADQKPAARAGEPEIDPAVWLNRPGSPKAKLAKEKPQGETIAYEELIKRWKM